MLRVFADTAGVARLAQDLASFGPQLPNAQARVINRVVSRTRERVIPALIVQTGLSKRIITKAVKVSRASPNNLYAAVYARGGEVSLRYFGAHEVAGGVDATVRGKLLQLRGHYFRRSGRLQRKFVTKLNRQVFLSLSGKWKTGDGIKGDLEVQKSGVFIGADLVDGATKQAFLDVIERDLPLEIASELAKLLPGR